jgi:hypothetical protein
MALCVIAFRWTSFWAERAEKRTCPRLKGSFGRMSGGKNIGWLHLVFGKRVFESDL